MGTSYTTRYTIDGTIDTKNTVLQNLEILANAGVKVERF